MKIENKTLLRINSLFCLWACACVGREDIESKEENPRKCEDKDREENSALKKLSRRLRYLKKDKAEGRESIVKSTRKNILSCRAFSNGIQT